jgi:hypothetical protein
MNTTPQLPKPRLVGRSIRILLGAVLLFFFFNLLVEISSHGRGFLATRPGWGVPGGGWWVAVILCFFVLPRLINSGFDRHWGAWPRLAFLILAGGAALWDWLAYGSFWAWPVASLVLLLVGYVLAHAGISYLVAGFAATPG